MQAVGSHAPTHRYVLSRNRRHLGGSDAQYGNRTTYRAELVLPPALRLAESVRMDCLGEDDMFQQCGYLILARTCSCRASAPTNASADEFSRPSPHGPARAPLPVRRAAVSALEIPGIGRRGTRGRGKILREAGF